MFLFPQTGRIVTSKDVAEGSDKDILELATIYLKTQPEHMPKMIKRFLEKAKSGTR